MPYASQCQMIADYIFGTSTSGGYQQATATSAYQQATATSAYQHQQPTGTGYEQ